jgi:hypothetical protein
MPLGSGSVLLGDPQDERFLHAQVRVQHGGQTVHGVGQAAPSLRSRIRAPLTERHDRPCSELFDPLVLLFPHMDNGTEVFPAAVEQLGPQLSVFRTVMCLQHRRQQTRVLSDQVRTFGVCRCDSAYKRPQRRELAPEHGVHQVHVTGVGRRFTILCCHVYEDHRSDPGQESHTCGILSSQISTQARQDRRAGLRAGLENHPIVLDGPMYRSVDLTEDEGFGVAQ